MKKASFNEVGSPLVLTVGEFTILITTFLAIFTSSQATEGKCKITEIVDYSYVHECEMDNGGFCSYTGFDETTITCNF